MGVERRAPPNPLRVSSETADGRGSILIDTTAAQQTITAPAQTPGLHCNKTSSFSFLFHLPFSFSNFYFACYLYGGLPHTSREGRGPPNQCPLKGIFFFLQFPSSAYSPASRSRSRVAQPTQVGGAEEAAGGEGAD